MRCHPLAALLLACVPVPASSWADAWLPVVEIAAGGGTKGPWRQNDSRYDYVDDGTVAFTPDGKLAVAWADQRRKEVLLQLRGADGRALSAPVDVSRSPDTFSWMPRIATSGADTLHLLWQEIIFSGGSHGGDILYARSLDGGRSFSRPVNLSASRAGDGKGRLDRATWSNGSLDIVAHPGGAVHGAWTDYEGSLWLARSPDGGRSFGAPRRIAGDAARPARAPALAVGADGHVYLAWTVGEDADADIRVAREDGKPVLVGAPGARADAPRLALDRAGRLHLVYLEGAGKGQARIRYARAGSDLVFGPPRTLSAPGEGVGAPQLALDADDRLHVAWDTPPHGLRYTVDAGSGFTPPLAVPGSADAGRNGSQQGLLGRKLAAGDRLVALVNSSLAPSQGSRVWLMRRRLPPG
ncbi:glycoside hydrolase [Massilia sp. IC2-477]|uniref:sialidase family protein n=1 Tax=Massilia sp. IC2-477 TaxID=2887198 RepID=UPI001D0FE300|nr:sialidase family protein [Massilia sp. IC2-477]MCC2958019.1 glycoside hydrolase [Massilia sp. IC2-477]